MNKFNNAPLPFMGQKRRFLKRVLELVKDHPDEVTYVDLFGGSGLLSHTIKQAKPSARVIYNDFDNYRHRLANIPNTNELLQNIRLELSGFRKGQKVPTDLKETILRHVKRSESDHGYVDYITISSALLFSMKYVLSYDELAKETFYCMVKQTDYDATGYLDGVEIVSSDYKEVFNRFKMCSNVIWLVDPPYLSTETKTYSSDNYWKLKDYLDVLAVVDGTNYLYFTSNKSQIIELCEWIGTKTIEGNPFHGSTMTTTDVQLNYNAGYTDILLYKFSGSTTQ